MLFAVKNRLLPTLLLLALFVAGATAVRSPLGLTWTLDIPPGFYTDLLYGGLALAASDGILHGLMWLVVGDPYRRDFRALAEFFRPQQVPQIVAGGLLAGGEELVFRGTLLEGLRTSGGISSGLAIAVTAIVFGLAHLIPQPRLWPFAFWAVWEGAMLGGIFVLSGSLLVVVVVHTLHDIVGFGIFAAQRKLDRAPA